MTADVPVFDDALIAHTLGCPSTAGRRGCHQGRRPRPTAARLPPSPNPEALDRTERNEPRAAPSGAASPSMAGLVGGMRDYPSDEYGGPSDGKVVDPAGRSGG